MPKENRGAAAERIGGGESVEVDGAGSAFVGMWYLAWHLGRYSFWFLKQQQQGATRPKPRDVTECPQFRPEARQGMLSCYLPGTGHPCLSCLSVRALAVNELRGAQWTSVIGTRRGPEPSDVVRTVVTTRRS